MTFGAGNVPTVCKTIVCRPTIDSNIYLRDTSE